MPITCTGTVSSGINADCSVPIDDELVDGAGLLTMAQGIENDIAAIKAGDCTFAGNKTFSGNTTCNGNVTIAQTKALIAGGHGVELRGTWKADSTGPATTFSGRSFVFDSTSEIRTVGRSVFSPARVALADADQPVTVAQGKRFTLATTPAAVPRVITLKSTGTGTVPDEGETLEFFCDAPNAVPGTVYQFVKEGGAHVAAIVNATVATAGVVWCEFEYVGGAWTLARSSGVAYDGADEYGVLLT